ncbi:MAG TPA: 4-(cytidine 5'-diphospho)-2-C-methyl-D-erythritol kinase [Thermodesulfobacteriota bacterium]|nr:4-(cytidine 5'-diphospho)-2-C-methyl-D-erythritol kinase [Thermodesulfobacteriota bacterium]
MNNSLSLESPAKVNLRLEILKRREDGYHELRTIFQKISLHDTLRFFLRKERGVSIAADHPQLPVGKNNLAYKAARSMLKASSYKGGIHIEIEKRIPLGAGLGGGSSNAATTLKALNQLLETGLPKKDLLAMGLEIGADVPFFLLKGAAIGSGIGEQLKRVELPDLWYVLIYPNFEVSTRWAYGNFVLTNQQFHLNLHRFLKNPKGISRILLNHLETVVAKKYPQIGMMKKILLSAGALGALMTGSGPTVFGLFDRESISIAAYEKIRRMAKKKGWAVFGAHSLTA